MITPIFQERRLRQRDVRLLDQGHTFVSGREGLIDLKAHAHCHYTLLHLR